MLKKDLAQELGISGAMVSKLAKRGMPTDSLERAQRWRKRHLEPGRVKGQRMGTTAPPAPNTPRLSVSPAADRASSLMRLAGSVVDAGEDVSSMLPNLRAALQAVPLHARDDVMLHVLTMRELIGPDVFDEADGYRHERDSPPTEAAPLNPPTVDDVEFMSNFWYAAAAGEIKILPKNPEPECELKVPGMEEFEWPEGWDKPPEL